MRLRQNKKSQGSIVSVFNGMEWAATSIGLEGLFLLGSLRVKTPTKCKEQDSLEARVQLRLRFPQ